MTQTAPLPTALTAAPGPGPAVVVAAPVRSDTPALLRRLSLGVVVLGVLVGIVGALVFGYLAVALNRAEADTAQLIRVQKIQTDLLAADATATNAFLVGGLEPPAQRAAYESALTEVGSLVAAAAQAQPADAAALAVLNGQVLDYAAAVEQARANNRQGFPVGSSYLRNASAQLRSAALPVLDLLVAANASRAKAAMSTATGFVFVAVAVLALVALTLAQIWLARRFHRRLNPGLLAASVVLFVALVAGLIGVLQLRSTVRGVSDGSFAAVNAAAAARIQGNDAKSNESLTLIARGSGTAFEKSWVGSASTVAAKLAGLPGQPGLSRQWQTYVGVHQAIRKLDDGGQWDAAVARATGTAKDSSNSTFANFNDSLANYLDGVSTTTSSTLSGTQPGLIAATVLTFLAGLAVALLGRRGIAERLREYR